MCAVVIEQHHFGGHKKLPAFRKKSCFWALSPKCGLVPFLGCIFGIPIKFHIFPHFSIFLSFSAEIYSDAPVFTENTVGTRTAPNTSRTGKTGTTFGNFMFFFVFVCFRMWYHARYIFLFDPVPRTLSPKYLHIVFSGLELIITVFCRFKQK